MHSHRWNRADWSNFLGGGGALVSVFGGLGNQLFQWSYGQYLKHHDGLGIAYVHVEKGVRVRSKRLPISETSIPGKLYRIRNPLRTPRSLRGFVRLIPGLREHEKKRVLPHIHAEGLGFEAWSGRTVSGKLVTGYWQSWKYAVAPDGLSFLSPLDVLPSKTSSWFREMAELALQEAPLMVHRRAGDYVGSVFGPPPKDWFGRAVREALGRLGDRPVWLFSDNKWAAEELRDLLPESNTRIIRPSPDSTSGESLVLMGLGVGNVLSNSTFSWWAAFLSKTSLLTIYPSPWFTRIASPVDLIPNHWEAMSR